MGSFWLNETCTANSMPKKISSGCRQFKRVAGAEPGAMFAEEHEGTKHVDSGRPVPDMHIRHVAAGNRGIVGGYGRGAPTAKHDEDLNELCPRASDNDRSCNGRVKPIRSADGFLECRAATLAQSENVASTDAMTVLISPEISAGMKAMPGEKLACVAMVIPPILRIALSKA